MPVVLVVEDDEQVRVMAESVLQEAGHTVICATGIDGSAAILDTHQEVDVLFIDLTLGSDPEAGLKVAQEAKAARPTIGVIYTTGAGVNAGMRALFVEPFLFLPKPYTFAQLTRSVAFLLLNSHPPVPPQLPQSN